MPDRVTHPRSRSIDRGLWHLESIRLSGAPPTPEQPTPRHLNGFPVAQAASVVGSRITWFSCPGIDLGQSIPGGPVEVPGGRVKRNTLPPPTFRSPHRRPPCASTMVRQTDKPIPMPSGLVVTNA